MNFDLKKIAVAVVDSKERNVKFAQLLDVSDKIETEPLDSCNMSLSNKYDCVIVDENSMSFYKELSFVFGGETPIISLNAFEKLMRHNSEISDLKSMPFMTILKVEPNSDVKLSRMRHFIHTIMDIVNTTKNVAVAKETNYEENLSYKKVYSTFENRFLNHIKNGYCGTIIISYEFNNLADYELDGNNNLERLEFFINDYINNYLYDLPEIDLEMFNITPLNFGIVPTLQVGADVGFIPNGLVKSNNYYLVTNNYTEEQEELETEFDVKNYISDAITENPKLDETDFEVQYIESDVKNLSLDIEKKYKITHLLESSTYTL